jgi:hypothetical protein
MLREGRFSKVKFIGGHCTDDGSIFVGNPATFVNTTDGFVAAIKARYTMLVSSGMPRCACFFTFLARYLVQCHGAKDD